MANLAYLRDEVGLNFYDANHRHRRYINDRMINLVTAVLQFLA